jgi:hypothetical protein
MPGERNAKVSGDRIRGESLMIGKMLQEIEESSDDKAKTAEI